MLQKTGVSDEDGSRSAELAEKPLSQNAGDGVANRPMS